MRILIVDDVEMIRTGMGEFLREHGHHVIEASNGVEAVACYSEHRPDAVLMDVNMPEMDGIAATRTIKEQDPEAHILLISGLVSPERTRAAVRAGAVDLVAKPVDSGYLFAVLQTRSAGQNAKERCTQARANP